MTSALAPRVAADLARLHAHLAAAAHRVRAGDDRKAAHDLRVASRRMASALDVWSGLLDAERARNAQKRLARLRRAAGPLRNAEVLRELLMRISAGLPPVPRLAVEDLARRFERRIARRLQPAARAARKSRVRRILQELERSRPPVRRPSSATTARTHAIDRVARLERSARAALSGAVPGGHDDALHAARITVKRWRYGLENLHAPESARAADAPRARALAETRALQRALGTLNDLAEVRTALEKRVRRLLERGRRAEAEALQAALPSIEREREAPLAELQGLVTTRRPATSRRRAG